MSMQRARSYDDDDDDDDDMVMMVMDDVVCICDDDGVSLIYIHTQVYCQS